MNYQILKAELDAGSYSPDPQVAANEINAPNITAYKEIASGTIRGYLAAIKKLFEIKAASEDPSHLLKDEALAVMLTMQPGGGIDFSDPVNIALLSTLKAGFSMTDEQEQAILSLGQITISKADSLELGKVRAADIEKARAL